MTLRRARFIVILIPMVFSGSLFAQKPTTEKQKDDAPRLSELIWRDPGDVASLNLLAGPGGPEHGPDRNGPFTFVKEDLDGTNPKFDVDDAAGVRWRVKLGEESQTETAASRLLWAAGYFVDEDYYLPQLTVSGLPPLHRGQNFVSPAGTVHGAGMERRPKDVKKRGDWDWFVNPFLETREGHGLRIMMALMNNWDLKRVNNSIEEIEGERRYLVGDLGATFGNTGNYFTRSKGVVASYQGTPFIAHTTGEDADFVLHTRPFVLTIFSVRHYREYARMESIVKDIPRADAKWLGDRLSRLSDEQLRDCFRAAGYTPQEVEKYADTVKSRIAALNAL
jgi:hypothetical protein